jgi:hypothetical protein
MAMSNDIVISVINWGFTIGMHLDGVREEYSCLFCKICCSLKVKYDRMCFYIFIFNDGAGDANYITLNKNGKAIPFHSIGV